jgi:hypothetical protein
MLTRLKNAGSKFVKFGLKAIIFGVAAGIVVILFALYQVRPKPWNANVITAEYKGVGTDGRGYVTFSYALKNHTTKDYRLSEYGRELFITRTDASLVDVGNGSVELDSPIFIPRGESVYVTLTLKYAYPKDVDWGQLTAPERDAVDIEIEEYVTEELPAFDGFAVLDTTNRYKILLPSGWRD